LLPRPDSTDLAALPRRSHSGRYRPHSGAAEIDTWRRGLYVVRACDEGIDRVADLASAGGCRGTVMVAAGCARCAGYVSSYGPSQRSVGRTRYHSREPDGAHA